MHIVLFPEYMQITERKPIDRCSTEINMRSIFEEATTQEKMYQCKDVKK